MTDAKFILVNNGMVMETLNGMIPDGRIIASNGSSIVCVVMPNNENKSMVASVLFISEENLEEHENNLRNSGYAFLEDGTYDSNGEARFYKIYQNDHKSCRISYPTNSDKTTRFEFTINRTVDASLPNIVALGDWLLTIWQQMAPMQRLPSCAPYKLSANTTNASPSSRSYITETRHILNLICASWDMSLWTKDNTKNTSIHFYIADIGKAINTAAYLIPQAVKKEHHWNLY